MKLAIDLPSAYVLSLFGVGFTNTLVTSILVTVVLTVIALIFAAQNGEPKSFLVRLLVSALRQCLTRIDNVTRDRRMSERIFPLIATFFLFILTANILALFPGFLGSFYIALPNGVHVPFLRSPNTDLSTTIALALISVAATQYFSLRSLKLVGYLRRFFNFKSPITLIIGFFELLSEAVKLLSFSFRLFGNMFAGEVLLLICAFLLPFILPVPFMFLELFVGFIQAFIFATLTLAFISISTISESSGETMGGEVLA